MTKTSVTSLLKGKDLQQTVTINGWVRTFRSNRFIALNDGSTINNIQCVLNLESFDEATVKRITTGAAICVTGTLVESQGKGQKYEIQVSELNILGDSNPFSGADNLWESFQNKINTFVNTNGGNSAKLDPIKNRPDWNKVKNVLDGTRPISDLGCN